MKKLFILPILILSAAWFHSCKKSDQPDDTSNKTIELVAKSAALVQVKADSVLLLTGDLYANFASIDTYIKSLPEVASTSLGKYVYSVIFRDGGCIDYEWSSFAPPESAGFTLPRAPARNGNPILPGYQEVLIVNQVAEDETFQFVNTAIDATVTSFEAIQGIVTVVDHTGLTLDFVRNSLKTYNIVFYIGHGSYADQPDYTWLYLGETVASMEEFVKNNYPYWTGGEIRVKGRKIVKNGKEVPRLYLAFSNLFVANQISSSNYQNKIFYTVACQSMKDSDEELATAFIGKGSQVFFGWNEIESGGEATGAELFSKLCSGYSIGEAYLLMDAKYFVSTTPYNPPGTSYAVLRWNPDNTATHHIRITDGPSTIDYSAKTIFTTDLCVPNQLVADQAGNLYVANHSYGSYGGPYANTVAKIDPAGNKSVFVSGYTWPSGIAIDRQENIYFTQNNASSTVTKVTPAGVPSVFANLDHSPGPVTLFDDGNPSDFVVYTLSHWGSKGIRKIDASGNYTVFSHESYICCELSPDGSYLYILSGSGLLRIRTSTGAIETLVTTITDLSTWSSVFGPDQKFYFCARSTSDSTKKAIFRLDGTSDVSEVITGIPYESEINDFVFVPTGTPGSYYLFVTEVAQGNRLDPASNRIIRFIVTV